MSIFNCYQSDIAILYTDTLNEEREMATLAPQKITEKQKKWLEREAKKAGESQAYIVRRELQKSVEGR